jgi:hypothetical protein
LINKKGVEMAKQKDTGINVQPIHEDLRGDELISDQALVPRNDETLDDYKKDPSRPIHPGSRNRAQGNPKHENEGLSSV